MKFYIFDGVIPARAKSHVRMWIFFRGPRGGRKGVYIQNNGFVENVTFSKDNGLEATVEASDMWKEVGDTHT